MKKAIAYVDGSYNAKKKVYGYGIVLIINDEIKEFYGTGSDPELISMHNVAGEITGAQIAITEAEKLGCSDVEIYYDYSGIELWATGQWKCKKPGTQMYAEFIKAHSKIINIHFQKVKAHSGVEYNNQADKLAKQGAGI